MGDLIKALASQQQTAPSPSATTVVPLENLVPVSTPNGVAFVPLGGSQGYQGVLAAPMSNTPFGQAILRTNFNSDLPLAIASAQPPEEAFWWEDAKRDRAEALQRAMKKR